MCSPPANLVPLHPSVGQLSLGPLHSILGNRFYSLEAVTLLANSSLSEYLGFFGEKEGPSGVFGNYDYFYIIDWELQMHFFWLSIKFVNIVTRLMSMSFFSPSLSNYWSQMCFSVYKWHVILSFQKLTLFLVITLGIEDDNTRVTFFYNNTNLNIRKSWSISESPWNSGLFVTISANIHPMLQISTGQEYLWQPKSTSGARYHRVTI